MQLKSWIARFLVIISALGFVCVVVVAERAIAQVPSEKEPVNLLPQNGVSDYRTWRDNS